MKNKTYKNLFTLILILLATVLYAQPSGGGGGVGGGGAPPGGGGAGAPIDGGAIGLLIGAAGYAYKQLRGYEKQKT